MTTDLTLLVGSTALTWVMLLFASTIRLRSWTLAGMKVGFGNRDDVPAPTPLAGRADRAAKNMLESFPLFAALVLTAHAGGVAADRLSLPCWIYFLARLAYFPVYVAGIPYLRTALWSASVVALAMLVAAMFG